MSSIHIENSVHSIRLLFVLPALAGKTHRDHFVHCCLLLSVVCREKRVNIWLYLPHVLMDFNQSWVIDATWKPSFVDEVKGHISRSKVISLCPLLSVVCREKRVNIWLYLPHVLMDFDQSWVIDATWKPSFVDEVKGHISRSKVI